MRRFNPYNRISPVQLYRNFTPALLEAPMHSPALP